MKIIEATWEKRNLGCDAYEVLLDSEDLANFDSVLEKIKEYGFSKKSYVVIKIPTGNIKALHDLQDNGFYFMETQLSLSKTFDNDDLEKFLYRHIGNMERVVVEKTRDEWLKIVEQITPDMFVTDRIALDPCLGLEQACTRYKNWIMDLLDHPKSVMFKLQKEEEIISFEVGVYNYKNILDALIGGVFAKYKGGMYGMYQNYPVSDYEADIRKKIVTVSTNNFPMLKIHQQTGMTINRMLYVLRKIYK